ncbi:hypothetical protein ACFC08_28465 [Streptomyces sp. NPDC056112]|uniref:hypothetical protein n=1 Tax=Streptomyces sp. NPDC056112 TaxID=3345715 RepID=UPI0035E2909F
MRGRGGRGHPVFTPEQRQKYLLFVADGIPLDEAANLAGVSRRTVNKHAAADPTFREARDEAKTAGRKARWDAKPHDEYRYIHGGCRCPECRAAASAARAARRATADEAGVDGAEPRPGTGPTDPTVISLPARDGRSDLPLRPLAAVS